MVVKDEEHHIQECLSSHRDVVDEIVILDNGSKDRTAKVAGAMGATVLYAEGDDMGRHRNQCVQHSTKEWILSVDTDERLSEFDKERLLQLTMNQKICAYRLPFVTYLRDGSWFLLCKTRLFPNLPGITWKGSVHESISPSLERLGIQTFDANIFYHHYGFLAPPARLSQKKQRYIQLMEKAIEEDPKNASLLDFLGIAYYSMGERNRAIHFFKQAIAADPGHARAYYNLARAYMVEGERALAIEQMKRAIELNPEMLLRLSCWSFLV